MKEWTLETLLGQLRAKIGKAGLGDILDESDSELLDMPLGRVLELLKEADFRRRMIQVQGQQVMHIDERGNVSFGDAPEVEAAKQAKARRTGTRVPEDETSETEGEAVKT